jgi:hypothetical protein
MNYELRETKKLQYHGIIHNHSACSQEGCYSLSVLHRRWAHRFDFAAMTEHAERTSAEAYALYVQECDALSDDRFRFIPGLEVATESGDMLLLGCRKYICTRDPFQVLEEASECLILLAHPEDGLIIPAVLERAHGFEGWNMRHMGGYMPPLDWLVNWRQELRPGQIMTGGNDIHKVDPRRKIVTVVRSHSGSETDILEAIKQGQFITSNGIFSVTANGHVLYRGRKVMPTLSILIVHCYRASRRGVKACLHLGGVILGFCGVDKQGRIRLRRLISQ